MFLKKINIFLIAFLLYQTPLYSKSTSLKSFDSKNLSKYFSGILAFENKDNSTALDFFNSSKILLNEHDPYLERYIHSLVLENKVSQAINIVKNNASPTKTILGGVCAVPNAILSNDITIKILTNEVIISNREGSKVMVVTRARISKDKLYLVV